MDNLDPVPQVPQLKAVPCEDFTGDAEKDYLALCEYVRKLHARSIEYIRDLNDWAASMRLATQKSLETLFQADQPVDFGAIYVDGGSTAQAGIGTSFVTMTGFDTNAPTEGDMTADAANDLVRVGDDGLYLFMLAMSFSGSNNATYTIKIAVNGTEKVYGFKEKLGSSGDITGPFTSGPLSLDALDEVTVIIKADAASKEITLDIGHLLLWKIGPKP